MRSERKDGQAKCHTYIFENLENGFSRFDNGLLFSINELYTRPGHSIWEFVEGKRVNHSKPLSLVILFASIFGLLYHLLDINLLEYGAESVQNDEIINKGNINELISTHYAIATILTIPISAMTSYLVFKKQAII